MKDETETETTQEVECRACNEVCTLEELDGAFECARCAAGELDDPDAEHREAFYLDIAGGCQ